MNRRAPYFSCRRRRLRRRHLCTRCGTERCKAGKSLCAACLTVEAVKVAHRRSGAERKEHEAKIKRLLLRLGLIDEARRAVQEELDRGA